jgi:hypothetical protein
MSYRISIEQCQQKICFGSHFFLLIRKLGEDQGRNSVLDPGVLICIIPRSNIGIGTPKRENDGKEEHKESDEATGCGHSGQARWQSR